MADASATFGIDIEETGGDDAAASLEALRAKILEGTGALRNMQAALRSMQGGTSVSIDAFKKLKDQIDAQKQSVAQASESFVKLGGDFNQIKAPKLEPATDSVGGFLGAIKGGAGPMGGFLEKIQAVRGAVQKMGAGNALAIAGAAALAAVLVIVTVAAISAAIAITKFALASADAARNSKLATEGLAASSKELAGLGKILPGLQAATGLSADELRGLAEQLEAAGVKAKDLPDALRAIATAKAGGASAAFLKQLNDDLKAGKKSAKELADEVNAKFGGIVARKLLSLDSQAERFKKNLAGIFANVKIEPFLKALAEIVALFDSSTASGRALKAMAEGILNPLFEALSALAPLAKGFFQGMVIGALLLTVAVLKVKNALRDAFGDSLGKIDLLKVGMYAGVAAFAALVTVGIVLAAVLASIALAVAFIALPFVIAGVVIGAVIYGVIYVIGLLGEAFMAAYNFIAGINFGELGSSIISGIVNAITGGAAWVWDAMKGLASGAIGAFKGALGISSPSKVFQGLGQQLPAGAAGGIEAGSDAVAGAAEGMASAAVSGASAGGEGGAPKGAGGGNVFNIVINAAGDAAAAIEAAVRKAITEALEEEAAMVGAP